MPEDRTALAEWVAHRDEGAFAALVSRHAGLVANTCLRHLGNLDAADEATQAVFILLAKHASQLRDPGRLSSWLYSTARRVCCRQQRVLARRKRHERKAAMHMDRNQDDGLPDPLWDEARTHLDDALAALSTAQRDAVVGCYLEGRAQADVATRLGVSEDVVKRRVHYALEKLRSWFARRGVAIPLSVLVVGISGEATAATPALVSACIQSAMNPATAPAAGVLAGKATTAMLIHKTVVIATLILTLGGGGTLAQRIVAAEKSPTIVPVKSATPAKGAHDPSTDWPQWRGPNRNGVALNSPQLLNAWPPGGPRQVWKTGWIPGTTSGSGMGSPVVADGKVYLYLTWRHPLGGGNEFHILSDETLRDFGWLPDIPEDLAKKIEDARGSPKRPGGHLGVRWCDSTQDQDKQVEAALKKSPAMDAYIKEFLATLPAKDAEKYGSYIKRRICPTTKVEQGDGNGISPTWDELKTLNTLRDKAYRTRNEWWVEIEKLHLPICAYGREVSEWITAAWSRADKVTDTVICLSAATGKEIWKKEFPLVGGWGNVVHPDMGSASTPAIGDGKCYVSGLNGLYCLSNKDGTPLWQAKGGGLHSSVGVVNGVVYNGLAAYNAETGQMLWKGEPGGAGPPSSVSWSSGGKEYIITSVGGGMYSCADIATGKEVWNTGHGPDVSGATPVVSGDFLVFMCGGTRAYRMTPTKAELLWKKPFEDGAASPVVYQDHLYSLRCWYNEPLWYCVDMKSGDEKWQQKSPIPGDTICSSPIIADGKIIFAIGQGHAMLPFKIAMLKATPEKYVQLGLFDPGVCPLSSPAIAGGNLYLRLQDSVACYDLTR